MVFYFSATGNSKAVAERIAQTLKDEAVDIVGLDPKTVDTAGSGYVGFVFPIFAWAAPEVVLRFAAQIDPGSAYTFAVCTFSNVTGLALEQFSKVFPLQSGYGIMMPDNFPVFDKIVETEDTARQKLAAAKLRLEEVQQKLLARERGFDTREGEDGENRTYVLSERFNESQRKTAPFWVQKELCTGCGQCREMCPAGAIGMRGPLPVWEKEDCYLCAACLNRCPVLAIQYGEFSKGKYRYVFNGFDI